MQGLLFDCTLESHHQMRTEHIERAEHLVTRLIESAASFKLEARDIAARFAEIEEQYLAALADCAGRAIPPRLLTFAASWYPEIHNASFRMPEDVRTEVDRCLVFLYEKSITAMSDIAGGIGYQAVRDG